MAWKPVPGYEERYSVNENGDIRSNRIEYVDSLGRKTYKKEQLLSWHIGEIGYARVALTDGVSVKHIPVHRIVAMAFIDNPNGYKFINHKDENKLNNNVSNLEWCTSKYNANYGTRNERMRKTLAERQPNSLPVIATKPDGTEEYYKSARHAERVLGYPHTGISNMLKGRTKTACGRVWRYAEVTR